MVPWVPQADVLGERHLYSFTNNLVKNLHCNRGGAVERLKRASKRCIFGTFLISYNFFLIFNFSFPVSFFFPLLFPCFSLFLTFYSSFLEFFIFFLFLPSLFLIYLFCFSFFLPSSFSFSLYLCSFPCSFPIVCCFLITILNVKKGLDCTYVHCSAHEKTILFLTHCGMHGVLV